MPNLLVPAGAFTDANLPAIENFTQAVIYAPRACDLFSYGFAVLPAAAGLREAVERAGALVDSAQAWAAVVAQIKAGTDMGNEVLTGLGISAAGYRKMGFSGGFPPEFRDGFASRAKALGATPPAEWNDAHWQGQSVFDLQIVLAAKASRPALDARKALLESLFPAGTQWTWQDGYIARNTQRLPTEHFGFVDGVGRPFFFEDPDRSPTRNYPASDPKASLGLILVPERFPAPAAPDAQFGSYGAFLKISENVDAFNNASASLAAAVGCPRAQAAEMIIGRKQDGAPLHHTGQDLNDLNPNAPASDWPHCSHTRKMDWRRAPHRRILRRGVIYDEPRTKGLLFHSFQKSIGSQFEFTLKDWVLNTAHPLPMTGPDPVIGDPKSPSPQNWPPGVSHTVTGLTRVEGGEYFYFPSLPSLRQYSTIPRISKF
jgi:Dyp-type peroxidase family